MLNVTKNNGNLWSLFSPWIFLTKSGSTWNHQPWSFRRLSSTLLWYGKQSHNQNALLRSPWPYETADPHATSHVSALTFCFLTVVGSPGMHMLHTAVHLFSLMLHVDACSVFPSPWRRKTNEKKSKNMKNDSPHLWAEQRIISQGCSEWEFNISYGDFTLWNRGFSA